MRRVICRASIGKATPARNCRIEATTADHDSCPQMCIMRNLKSEVEKRSGFAAAMEGVEVGYIVYNIVIGRSLYMSEEPNVRHGNDCIGPDSSYRFDLSTAIES